MKMKALACGMLALLGGGCLYFPHSGMVYREVWLENTVDVDITSVNVGSRDDKCSEFGVLGTKGAGKVAGVPLRFAAKFPIEWEENFDNTWHHAVVDLRRFKDTENRAIILRYTGDGKWEAVAGREIPPRKDK